MEHILPALPYAHDALAPVISKETIDYHYGKHHQTYVTNLNKLIAGTRFETLSLEDIITSAPEGGIFNNAAQVWNHTFYWNSLTPGGSEISGELLNAIEKKWGSVDEFKKSFAEAGAKQFGSGWVWLVANADNSVEIVATSNAANPMTNDQRPLITCDVWEHAYYIDYKNARPKYLESFFKLANWEFAAKNFLANEVKESKAA